MVQGKVLQDLMWQLEAAIHPQAPLLQAQPPRNAFGTSNGSSTYSSTGSMDYDTPSSQQLLSQGPPWFLPPPQTQSLAHRDTSEPAWAGGGSSSSYRSPEQGAGSLPFGSPTASTTSGNSSSSGSAASNAATNWGLPAAGAGVFSPVGLSRQIPRLLDSTPPARQTSSSPLPNSSTDFTRRPVPVAVASNASNDLSLADATSLSTTSPLLSSSPSTIDLEVLPSQGSESNRDSGLASVGLPASASLQVCAEQSLAVHTQQSSSAAPPRSSETCDLVSSIVDILTAGQRLASASGIHMVVNRPLVTAEVTPRSSTRAKKSPPGLASRAVIPPDLQTEPVRPHAHSSSSQPEQLQQRSSPNHSSSPSPAPPISLPPAQQHQSGTELMPRPSRSLFVSVSATVLVRLLSYVLDLVLQCTPRGGALQVAARQDGQNVSVILLHSGTMVAGRWHTSSPGMIPRPQKISQTGTLSGQPALLSESSVGKEASVSGRNGGDSLALSISAAAGRAHSSRRARLDAGTLASTAGSTILNVELAQELAAQVGGRLSVSFPRDLVNHVSGCLEAGSCVELSLPRAC